MSTTAGMSLRTKLLGLSAFTVAALALLFAVSLITFFMPRAVAGAVETAVPGRSDITTVDYRFLKRDGTG